MVLSRKQGGRTRKAGMLAASVTFYWENKNIIAHVSSCPFGQIGHKVTISYKEIGKWGKECHDGHGDRELLLEVV